MGERLCFSCRVCGQVAVPKLTVKDGFCFLGYEDLLEWSDGRQPPVPVGERYWQRGVVLPKSGEKRAVRAHFPFDFAIGDMFWVLYQPALSSLNGWWEMPEELDQSAMVRCQFQQVLERGTEGAWICVQMLDVLPLPELCHRLPPHAAPNWLDELLSLRRYQVLEYGRWLLYEWSDEGDVGVWALMQRQVDGTVCLVLYAEWGFHEHNIHCGNCPVSADVVERLLEHAR